MKSGQMPPRMADAFLQWYCDESYLEEVQGDLHELFFSRLSKNGGRLSYWLYWLDVMRFFRPYLFKRSLFKPKLGSPIMFQNYLKIAMRSLLKHKAYSSINISGLVMGMTACILILLYVRDELSFDNFHANGNGIYRVTHEQMKDGNWRHFAYNFGALAPALEVTFPELEKVVRVFPNSVVVRLDEQKRFQEAGFIFADSTFFDLFSFEFMHGSEHTALSSPYDLVLTEKTANKYFGDQNPIGKTLTVEGSYDFRVTGVLRDLPANSHLQFDFVAAMGSMREIMGWALSGWHYPPMYTYVLLSELHSAQNIEARFPDLIGSAMGEWAREERRLHLQPLAEIHLTSNLEGEMTPGGNQAYLYIFGATALFILLIACINFMNLATARSAGRAREVGLRKVVGASRKQLVSQFLGESSLHAFFSLLVTLFLVELILPYFNKLVDKQLTLDYSQDWHIVLMFAGLALLVGLVSGSYPAVYLSHFRPITVLKGNVFSHGEKGGFRAVLVVAQFAISITLIISASIIKDQLSYIRNKSLGFTKEQLVVIPVRDDAIQADINTVRQRFLADPDVLGVTATSAIPGIDRYMAFPAWAEGFDDETQWDVETMMVDHDFIKTFGMEIVSGRDFSKTHPTDINSAFILNETAVRRLGWEAPLGKKFEMTHITGNGKPKRGEIVGVVKDFHFRPLHQTIAPMVLQISTKSYYLDNLALRIKATNMPKTLAALEKEWQALVPHRPFEYKFLDSVFDQIYRKEQKLGEIFQYFSALAIFIGCLGLFGLASYTAEQRTREIGIRKVLGASVPSIVGRLSLEFLVLVGVAFIVASPLAYYIMNNWLQDFTYHVDIRVTTFLISGAAALLLALLTVSYQAIKAAYSNPVQALRYQ